MKVNKRIFITVADLVQLTGKGQQACYRTLRKIKAALNKQSIKDITFEEYFKHLGIADYKHYLQALSEKRKN